MKLIFLWSAYASIVIDYTQKQKNAKNVFIRVLCLEIISYLNQIWGDIVHKHKQSQPSLMLTQILGEARPYQLNALTINDYQSTLLKTVGILQKIADTTTLGSDPAFSGNSLYSNALITKLLGSAYQPPREKPELITLQNELSMTWRPDYIQYVQDQVIIQEITSDMDALTKQQERSVKSDAVTNKIIDRMVMAASYNPSIDENRRNSWVQSRANYYLCVVIQPLKAIGFILRLPLTMEKKTLIRLFFAIRTIDINDDDLFGLIPDDICQIISIPSDENALEEHMLRLAEARGELRHTPQPSSQRSDVSTIASSSRLFVTEAPTSTEKDVTDTIASDTKKSSAGTIFPVSLPDTDIKHITICTGISSTLVVVIYFGCQSPERLGADGKIRAEVMQYLLQCYQEQYQLQKDPDHIAWYRKGVRQADIACHGVELYYNAESADVVNKALSHNLYDTAYHSVSRMDVWKGKPKGEYFLSALERLSICQVKKIPQKHQQVIYFPSMMEHDEKFSCLMQVSEDYEGLIKPEENDIKDDELRQTNIFFNQILLEHQQTITPDHKLAHCCAPIEAIREELVKLEAVLKAPRTSGGETHSPRLFGSSKRKDIGAEQALQSDSQPSKYFKP